MGRPLHRFKCLADNVVPRLGQHLDRHVLRDHIPLDELPDKPVLRIGSRREPHFDLLKANLRQHPEKFQLFFQAHGFDQRLVAVPQIHAAPDGRFFNGLLFHPVITYFRGHKIRFSVFRGNVHLPSPFPLANNWTKKRPYENPGIFIETQNPFRAVPLYFAAKAAPSPARRPFRFYRRAYAIPLFTAGAPSAPTQPASVLSIPKRDQKNTGTAFGRLLRGQFTDGFCLPRTARQFSAARPPATPPHLCFSCVLW